MRSRWTRRQLLQTGGLSVAGVLASDPALASVTGWLGQPESQVSGAGARSPVLYSAVNTSSEEGVEVRVWRGEQWVRAQLVTSASPTSLTLSPDGRTLVVTNGVSRFANLPTGSVESWSIDQRTGKLMFLSRQGLALTATRPTELAISGDGRTLAVLAGEGSVYTLLPVTALGEIGELTAVRKELVISSAADPAARHSSRKLRFAAGGVLLAANLAAGTLSTFACCPGEIRLVRREELSATARTSFEPDRISFQAKALAPAQASPPEIS